MAADEAATPANLVENAAKADQHDNDANWVDGEDSLLSPYG
jgi:hypothetical protein